MREACVFLVLLLATAYAVDDEAVFDAGKGTEGEAKVSKGFLDAFFSSFAMILVSEIGDETFIIAALMAMSHPRVTVFLGAFGALVIMTVLSTGLGIILPNLISRGTVRKFACVLYTAFGLRLLYIAWKTKPEENSTAEEIKDVEAQLRGDCSDNEDGNEKHNKKPGSIVRRLLSNVCDPIFLEALILTFLAEWGDRSQLATIALATHYNGFGVTLGGVLGHCICTAGAVIGGKMLAEKISPRPVAIFGGVTFLGCAYYAYAYGESLD